MSFGSADRHLKEMGVTNETANDNQREEALWKAFWEELPAGMAYLENLVKQAHEKGDMVIGMEDHTEDTIKDCQRLIGNSIPRQILEKRWGVPFESYNCHYPATAPTRDKLKMTMQVQIDLQNGRMASVHC